MTRRIFLLVLTLTLIASAALPPLSDEERFNQSTDIVVGEVRAVKSKEEKVKQGTDWNYTAEVVVQSIVKGPIKPGDVIKVQFDKTGKRPMGWAGPQGQNEVLKEGTRARLYMTKDIGYYRLLVPNGWTPAP